MSGMLKDAFSKKKIFFSQVRGATRPPVSRDTARVAQNENFFFSFSFKTPLKWVGPTHLTPFTPKIYPCHLFSFLFLLHSLHPLPLFYPNLQNLHCSSPTKLKPFTTKPSQNKFPLHKSCPNFRSLRGHGNFSF